MALTWPREPTLVKTHVRLIDRLMKTTAWFRLPNAAQIDLVLSHMAAHKDIWASANTDAWADHPGTLDGNRAKDAAETAIGDLLRRAIWRTLSDTVCRLDIDTLTSFVDRDDEYANNYRLTWNFSNNAAMNAVLALTAWDHCGSMLDVEPDQVRNMVVSGDKAALLLLAASIALHSNPLRPTPILTPVSPQSAPVSPPLAPALTSAGVETVELLFDGRPVLKIRVDTVVGRLMLKPISSDAQFANDTQFRIHRSPAREWVVSPIAGTENETLVDGARLLTATPLRDGMRLAVGNSAKGIEKLPLVVYLV